VLVSEHDPIEPGVDPAAPDTVLEELLAAFADIDATRDADGAGVPVPDMSLDDLLNMFGPDSPAAPEVAPVDTSGTPAPVWPAPPRREPAPPRPPEPAIEPTIDWLGEPLFGPDGAAIDPPVRDEIIEADLDDTSTEIVVPPQIRGDRPGGDDFSNAVAFDEPTVVIDDALGPFDETVADPVLGLADGPSFLLDDTRDDIEIHRLAADESGELRSVGGGAAPIDPLVAGAAAVPGRSTIVIEGDDLPDTLYLDEENERRLRQTHGDDTGDGRDTVFIGDIDGVDFTEVPYDLTARPTGRGGAIDPRVRARRVAVRRAEGRRRLFWVGVGLGAVVLSLLAVGVVASPLFGVDDVVVQGATYTDTDVLDAIIEELSGDAVLLVDSAAIEARLEEVPWVERARVDPTFPGTVVIDIRERRALASFQGGDGRWRVIDVQGRVLDVLDGQPVAYMPIIGVHPDTARGQFAGAPYAAAAALVQVLPAEVRAVTRSVGLDAVTGTLTLELTSATTVRLGSADDLDLKLARLLGQVRGGLDGVVSLDVSTGQIGVVRE
jgi:cell division protein FtsQ